MVMKDPAPGKVEANMGDNIGLVHLSPDDDPIFILTKEHDFGQAATAVAEKITDYAPCAGEILAVFLLLTEAKTGGSGDDVTCIAKDAGASTKMSGDLTLDMSDTTPGMNAVGSVRGLAPHGTEANRQFAKGDDLYAYTDAQTTRGAGKYLITVICKKIA
jgi:hypothetical protein